MSSEEAPKYLQGGEAKASECKDLISAPFGGTYVYQYQGFWCLGYHLQGVISCQKRFEVQDSDIFLASVPKSGTTWLKAIMFTLVNRKRYPVAAGNHPLLAHNPQDLVPHLESVFRPGGVQIVDIASSSCPRLFSTHIPYDSVPESMKKSSTCKFVYICRNPKDAFVSLWHFRNKLWPQEMRTTSIGEFFERFCNGVSPYGPFWDHVLQYWKQSEENPDRVLFLKFEDMKDQPALHLRRLAEFLDCPFSTDEAESGLVEQILKLCSFDNLSGLEVNKNGKLLSSGVENSAFFRRGEVGDWKNHLSTEMAQKLDQITEEKLFGSGLVL